MNKKANLQQTKENSINFTLLMRINGTKITKENKTTKLRYYYSFV